MRIVALATAAAALALLLAGPERSGAQSPACRGAQKPQQVAELMLGRKVGDRIAVSERAFARFVDREIVPRFPDGLTVLDTVGHWRDPVRKRVIREPGKIVHIVLPGHPDDVDRLAWIAEAYKARFRQKAVGVIVRPACVSF